MVAVVERSFSEFGFDTVSVDGFSRFIDTAEAANDEDFELPSVDAAASIDSLLLSAREGLVGVAADVDREYVSVVSSPAVEPEPRYYSSAQLSSPVLFDSKTASEPSMQFADYVTDVVEYTPQEKPVVEHVPANFIPTSLYEDPSTVQTQAFQEQIEQQHIELIQLHSYQPVRKYIVEQRVHNDYHVSEPRELVQQTFNVGVQPVVQQYELVDLYRPIQPVPQTSISSQDYVAPRESFVSIEPFHNVSMPIHSYEVLRAVDVTPALDALYQAFSQSNVALSPQVKNSRPQLEIVSRTEELDLAYARTQQAYKETSQSVTPIRDLDHEYVELSVPIVPKKSGPSDTPTLEMQLEPTEFSYDPSAFVPVSHSFDPPSVSDISTVVEATTLFDNQPKEKTNNECAASIHLESIDGALYVSIDAISRSSEPYTLRVKSRSLSFDEDIADSATGNYVAAGNSLAAVVDAYLAAQNLVAVWTVDSVDAADQDVSSQELQLLDIMGIRHAAGGDVSLSVGVTDKTTRRTLDSYDFSQSYDSARYDIRIRVDKKESRNNSHFNDYSINLTPVTQDARTERSEPGDGTHALSQFTPTAGDQYEVVVMLQGVYDRHAQQIQGAYTALNFVIDQQDIGQQGHYQLGNGTVVSANSFEAIVDRHMNRAGLNASWATMQDTVYLKGIEGAFDAVRAQDALAKPYQMGILVEKLTPARQKAA